MNRLGEVYSKLGLSDKIALATIDVGANDVPHRIVGYPTLKLYRADTNEIVDYEGGFHEMLTVEQIDSFIYKNGAHGISAFAKNEESPDSKEGSDITNHDEL
jgi:protein disulfide-isomerase A1